MEERDHSFILILPPEPWSGQGPWNWTSLQVATLKFGMLSRNRMPHRPRLARVPFPNSNPHTIPHSDCHLHAILMHDFLLEGHLHPLLLSHPPFLLIPPVPNPSPILDQRWLLDIEPTIHNTLCRDTGHPPRLSLLTRTPTHKAW